MRSTIGTCVADPDRFGKPNPDSARSASEGKAGSGSATESKYRSCGGSKWRRGDSKWSRGWSVDQWSELHITFIRSWIRIRIKEKSRILIKGKVKVGSGSGFP
jgi:hypothetical protein